MIRTFCRYALIVALVAAFRPAEAQLHTPPPPLAADPAPAASDLTAGQLIAKANAARGEEQKLTGIHSVTMTGTWTNGLSRLSPHAMSASGLRSPSPITVMIAPGRYLRRIEQGSGVPIAKVVNGASSWETSPQRGAFKPRPMADKDSARFRLFADPQGPLVNHVAKGNTIEVVGKMPWQGSQVYKLKVTSREGGVFHLYLDAKTFLPVRVVTTLYVHQWGENTALEIVYDDFRDVQGVKWPFTEKANAPEINLKQSTTWSRIEVNQPLDEAAFKEPQS